MSYEDRITQLKTLISEADVILIGAGAGLSTAAGIDYGGNRFMNNFSDYKKIYGIPDMYSGMFHRFATTEEKWAYRAKHVYVNYYNEGPKELYTKLFDLMREKEYFVLTTNGDRQFYKTGFNPNRIFAPQGNYSKFQCSKGCHNEVYDNKDTIEAMLDNTIDYKVDKSLVPYCPRCGEEMTLQLRVDNYYVEDKIYDEGYNNYVDFMDKIVNKKLLLLEFGVGYNTPGIIRYPFETLTYQNSNTKLVRFNKDYPNAIPENKRKTICFSESIEETLNRLM